MELMENQYVSLVRLQVVQERILPYGKEKISSPICVASMARSLLENTDKECLLVIPVDVKSKPLGIEFAAIGGLNCVHAFAREIFKHAIVSNAFGVIIVHNHPSGEVLPSEEDWRFTRCMQEAGDLLGVELLDHIILGEEEKYFSMQETHRWNLREKYVCKGKEAS